MAQAAEALEHDEFPIATMVVLDNEIIFSSTASEQREKRFFCHAELVALEDADKQSLSYRQRSKAILYTNLVPCLMCMGAAMSFFLGEIVYCLESPGDGAVDLVRSWIRKEGDFPGYKIPNIIPGLLREVSINLFKEYLAFHESGPMRDWAKTLTYQHNGK